MGRLAFRNIESGFVETSYEDGSEGAALLTADPDWEQIGGPEVKASDAAAKLAEEAGIDLASIEGTGRGGSITKGDVETAIDALEDDGDPEDE